MTFDPLAFPGPLKRGARDTNPSGPVHRLQGWLCLHGYTCAVDGDFGPETEHRLKMFQGVHPETRGDAHGLLGDQTWSALTAPLARAMAPLDIRTFPELYQDGDHEGMLGRAVAAVSRQWRAQRVGGGPLRELPGNSGPVVEACTRRLAERDRLSCFCSTGSGGKLICKSYECAPDWRLPWCAGWVSTVLRQACESLGVPMPLRGSLACDVLGAQAIEEDMLEWSAPDVAQRVQPGAVFLQRAEHFDPDKPDWKHCGVVLEVLPGVKVGSVYIRTAEGNTNADGSRNGTELRERIRGLEELDIICWRDA